MPVTAPTPHRPLLAAPAAILAGLALACAARPAAAQQAAGLTLEQAVERTLAAGPSIQLAQARLDAGRGALLTAGGRFDARLGASVSGTQESTFATASGGGLVDDPTVSRATSYSLEGSRQLRSGVILQPSLTVTRTAVVGVPVAQGGSSVGLNVTVPLLRDRWGRASVATERSARAQYGADAQGVRQAAAAGVLDAVAAYWEYAAAQARLGVYTEVEERARRLLEETRVLVQGDERPAADLQPLMAGLAAKRVARIGAEQGVLEARRRLGLAMGLDAAGIAALPTAATPFPQGVAWAPDAAETDRLVRLALAGRPDLAGAALETRAAQALLDGARSETRPRLDLALGVGYTGTQLSSGYGQLVRPLYDNIPGVNASVRFQYQLPVGNQEARGVELQRAAAHRQQSVSERDLAARVASGVAVAAQALARRAAELAEAEQAAALYRTTVDNERQKNRLGASTLFDVTYAEDNLTSAMLNVVASRLGYAVALAELRYETGTLVAPGERPAVDAPALTTRP